MGVPRSVAAGLALAVAVGVGYGIWHAYLRGDERIIRERLDALAGEVNEGGSEGLGLVARAAKIGSFFTEDVTVDLGEGTAPIRGRRTLMAMAARLEPRTSAFTVAFDDVTVEVSDGAAAEVNLTATFTRQAGDTTDSSMDARELNVGMKKIEGQWLIARVAAVEPLEKR
jgi:hypothetical protein